jgi:hypothetical protein
LRIIRSADKNGAGQRDRQRGDGAKKDVLFFHGEGNWVVVIDNAHWLKSDMIVALHY